VQFGSSHGAAGEANNDDHTKPGEATVTVNIRILSYVDQMVEVGGAVLGLCWCCAGAGQTPLSCMFWAARLADRSAVMAQAGRLAHTRALDPAKRSNTAAARRGSSNTMGWRVDRPT
jgi:hypothetical protein